MKPARTRIVSGDITVSKWRLFVSNMTNDQSDQELIGWRSNVSSLLTEMKRRAGVGSDRELARFMRVSQSTVSHWRTRGAIPDAAILKFERSLVSASEAPQHFAARVVVLRLAEFWYQDLKAKGAAGGRRIPYQSIAMSINALTDVIAEHIKKYEAETGLEPYQLADHLVEDGPFLTQIIEWLKQTSAAEMAARETRAGVFAKGE